MDLLGNLDNQSTDRPRRPPKKLSYLVTNSISGGSAAGETASATQPSAPAGKMGGWGTNGCFYGFGSPTSVAGQRMWPELVERASFKVASGSNVVGVTKSPHPQIFFTPAPKRATVSPGCWSHAPLETRLFRDRPQNDQPMRPMWWRENRQIPRKASPRRFDQSPLKTSW